LNCRGAFSPEEVNTALHLMTSRAVSLFFEITIKTYGGLAVEFRVYFFYLGMKWSKKISFTLGPLCYQTTTFLIKPE
jgi:hypothetical protein